MSVNFDAIIDRHHTACLKYDFAAERGYPEDVLPFWVADMDFRAPQPVLDALAARIQHGIFGYTDVKPDYVATLQKWMQAQHGWRPAADSLLVTPGVVLAIALAIRAFTEPGEAVLIQQPVYYPFSLVIKDNGRELVNSPLREENGRYHIDFADIEDKIVRHHVRLFLLCSPHNPVGRVWTRDELTRLADICLRHDVLILADEIHHDFVRPGYTHTVLASLSPEFADRTITCTAPSKTFNLAGLQLSNIFIANATLRRRFRHELNAIGYDQPNAMGLTACQAAYANGGPWLQELRAYLESNYQKTHAFLTRELPRVRLTEPEGTYLLWLDFSAYGLSDEELDKLIVQKARLWLDSGHIFGPAGSQHQRLNIACPWATLEQGLQRLTAALPR